MKGLHRFLFAGHLQENKHAGNIIYGVKVSSKAANESKDPQTQLPEQTMVA